MITKKRYLEIERFHARTPDGRLLLIERTHDLGLAPRLQSLISLYTVPIALVVVVFGAPFIPAVMFAGFWSYILFVFSAVALSAIAQTKLIDWMQNFDTQPDTCDVIGMDCSTEELLTISQNSPSHHPIQGSLH